MGQPRALRTGVDIIDVERVQRAAERHGERFYRRFFTPTERAYCYGRSTSAAVRIAAKEAVAKALGTGIGVVRWVDIEVINGELGSPELVLHGAAADRASQLGLTQWALSLSHTHRQAVAFVVALGPETS